MNPRTLIAAIVRNTPWLGQTAQHTHDVMRGAGEALALRLVGTGLAFAFNVLLARALGALGAGVYYLALSVTSIAAVLGQLGLANAVLRFTAASASQADWPAVAGVYRKGVLITMAAAGAATMVVVVGASWIARFPFSDPALTSPLRTMALGILPLSLLTLHGEFLRGLEKIRESVLVRSVGVPLFSLPLLVAFSRPLGTNGAILAYVLATALVLGASMALWRQATPQLRRQAGHFDTRLLTAASMPLFWVDLSNILMTMMDTVLLGIWVENEAVGIYNVAKRTALLTSFVLVAVNRIAAPRFAALYASGDRRALSALARDSARLIALFASPLLLLFVLAPAWVLRLFGSEFAAGGSLLAILAVGQFVNAATGSVGALLMMSGHEKVQRNISFLSTALNFALNMWLIPHFGVMGAAVASTVSLAIQNLVSVYLVRKHLSIKIWAFRHEG